jgi:hypothetical protein
MAEENGKKVREHRYHAEAGALHANLDQPLFQKIEPQALSKVRPIGGYESQHAKPFRLEGIVSFSAAHTQVAGHEERNKPSKGFKTLATSVVEDLNILNVVTADRVVAQVSTNHPRYEEDGHVPAVTFLGTQFYNLRIAGFPVEVELDLDLLNPADHSGKIAFTKNEGFLKRLATRFDVFRQGGDEVPADLRKHYSQGPLNEKGKECTEYSLVKAVKGKFPGQDFGHVLEIPHFGRVFLGVVRIEHSDHEGNIPKTTLIDLTMIEARMGCIGSGTVSCTVTKNNGGTVPGGG